MSMVFSFGFTIKLLGGYYHSDLKCPPKGLDSSATMFRGGVIGRGLDYKRYNSSNELIHVEIYNLTVWGNVISFKRWIFTGGGGSLE